MAKISRAAYADMYGPTTGDKVRLADTELFIEVENDLTIYGEEVKFGGTTPKNLEENLSELKLNLEILLITIVNLLLIAVDIIFMFL